MRSARGFRSAAVLRRAPSLTLAAVALAALVACAKVAGIDGLEIGECKGGGACDAGGGEPEGGATPGEDTGARPVEGGAVEGGVPCVSAHGPAMVRVGTTTNNFCIDSTEVTVAHYREFTTANSDAGGQPAQCAWNTTYAALSTGADDLPVAGIDWCDARAYCAWAGKRLCGKQQNDRFVGSVTAADLGDFTTNEWFAACSNVGQLRYPYGEVEQPTACNTGENDAGKSLPVRSKTACQGGFAGVFDMLGNVAEWFDGPCPAPDGGALDGGAAKDVCFVKGGSFANSGVLVDCRVELQGITRDLRSPDIGVRCCSD